MTSPDSPSLSRGTPEMDQRDADVLLDQFANALYMHRNDESPKDAVAGCEVCGPSLGQCADANSSSPRPLSEGEPTPELRAAINAQAKSEIAPVSPPLSTSSPELTKLLDDFTTAIHVYNESKTDRGPRALVEGAFKLQAIVAARSAIELSFATLTETARKYEMLCRAVNDNSGECSTSCNSYGHAEDCEYVEMAPSLRIQQEKIAALLSENERLREELAKALDREQEAFEDSPQGQELVQLRLTALTPEEAQAILDENASVGPVIRAKLRALSGETPK